MDIPSVAPATYSGIGDISVLPGEYALDTEIVCFCSFLVCSEATGDTRFPHPHPTIRICPQQEQSVATPLDVLKESIHVRRVTLGEVHKMCNNLEWSNKVNESAMSDSVVVNGTGPEVGHL